jgi:hypothetical protein
VNVLCCQVKVSAAGRSLVQLSPTKCGVSEVSNPPKQGGLSQLGQSNYEKRKAVDVLNSKFKGINMIRNVNTHSLKCMEEQAPIEQQQKGKGLGTGI